jgi:hypothetical protein
VFYQLVSRSVIEKTEKAYKGTVVRLMAEMRLDGELPWSWGNRRNPPPAEHPDLR